jgi:hypothetical protein
LINISTRGFVGAGDNVLIGGFIIEGSAQTVLVRVPGPSLAALGVSGVLANPTVELFSGQTSIAFNDDWQTGANTSSIPTALRPLDSREPAILITLNPGAYTAIVRGAGGTTGVALVEVFALSGGGGGNSTNLSDLLGRWEFVYTIISQFRDHFDLQRIVAINGIEAIAGVDLDFGGSVVVARVSDLIDDPFPYTFALLDPDLGICDFFVFDKTGVNTVEGAQITTTKDAVGNCDDLIGTPHPMVGTRTGAALQDIPARSAGEEEALKLQEEANAAAMPMLSLPYEGGRSLSRDTIRTIVRSLQE